MDFYFFTEYTLTNSPLYVVFNLDAVQRKISLFLLLYFENKGAYVKIVISEYWDIGRRRVNEDSILVAEIDSSAGNIALCAVADGIGGLDEGHVASGYVLEKINQCFYEQLVPMILRHKSVSLLKRCIVRCLYETNQELRSYGDIKGISLGTTLSLVLVFRGKYILCHLGDSGIFKCNCEAAVMISRRHASAKGVNRCLGSFAYMKPDMDSGKIRHNEGFLITSDGFYSNMDYDASFWNPVAMGDEEKINRRLKGMGELIRSRGQTDNASAVYIGCL